MACHLRSIVGLVILLFLAFPGAGRSFYVSAQQSDEYSDFTHFLQKLAEYSPDPCGPPYGREDDWHTANIELHLFDRAETIITKGLNAESGKSESPKERAATALRKLEQLSAGINVAWPNENRFHFEVLDLPPALLVKMSIRAHETYSVFGIPENDDGTSKKLWAEVGSNSNYLEHETPNSRLDLYPLTRGPSGRVRFLARFTNGGCAGSIGVAYDAREWDPKSIGNLEQIIELNGAIGLDDKVPGFAQIGDFQTKGPKITLPYCWFSAIDTWDNPSLCAVDTYDISGDKVKFLSRAYNRPDLVPIAKVIEYSKQRDYPAVRGYCASSQVAQKLVRSILPYLYGEDVRVTRKRKDREHVEFGFETIYSFDVQKIGDRWKVVTFGIKRD